MPAVQTELQAPSIEEYMPVIDKMLCLYGEERSSFYWARNGRVLHAKESKAKGQAPKHLNRGYIYQHLLGQYAVCVIGSPDSSRFTSFDVDSGGWEMATRVINALEQLGIDRSRIYISTSGGKGYHIEMFYDRAVSYAVQRVMYRKMLRMIGATIHEVEFRPTHTQAIKLPLSRHHKTGNWCWYLNRTDGTPIEDREYVLSIERMEAATIERIAGTEGSEEKTKKSLPSEISEEKAPKTQVAEKKEKAKVEYENVDLSKLPAITAPGMRHDLTLNIAISCRKSGNSKNETLRLLYAWYEEQDKHLTQTPREEALQDIENIVQWVFDRFDFKAWTNGDYKTVNITATHVEQILSVKGLIPRAMVFYTQIHSVRKKKNRATEREMAEIFHSDKRTISEAKARLEKAGVIEVKLGKAVRTNDGFAKGKSTLSIKNIDRKVRMPDVALKNQTAAVDFTALDRNFWRVYFDALLAIADREWLMKQLGKRERDKLIEIEHSNTAEQSNERKNENGTQD